MVWYVRGKGTRKRTVHYAQCKLLQYYAMVWYGTSNVNNDYMAEIVQQIWSGPEWCLTDSHCQTMLMPARLQRVCGTKLKNVKSGSKRAAEK